MPPVPALSWLPFVLELPPLPLLAVPPEPAPLGALWPPVAAALAVAPPLPFVHTPEHVLSGSNVDASSPELQADSALHAPRIIGTME
jgi:hypothetical protein